MSRVLHIALIGVALATTLAGCSTSPSSAAATPPVAQAQAPVALRTPFRATGNEPSWRLDISDTEMILLTDFGQTRTVAATPRAEVSNGTTRYIGRTGPGELVATIVDRPCVDSMSGMPHPQSVTVDFGGQVLTGCGGEPVSLLQGAGWTVVEIDGAPPVAGSEVTLAFAPDGRLSGQASCNRFMSEYTLSGEGLAIAMPAGTRMMCDGVLMDQERRFLEILAEVRGFSVGTDGALLLQAGDGRIIKAQRR